MIRRSWTVFVNPSESDLLLAAAGGGSGLFVVSLRTDLFSRLSTPCSFFWWHVLLPLKKRSRWWWCLCVGGQVWVLVFYGEGLSWYRWVLSSNQSKNYNFHFSIFHEAVLEKCQDLLLLLWLPRTTTTQPPPLRILPEPVRNTTPRGPFGVQVLSYYSKIKMTTTTSTSRTTSVSTSSNQPPAEVYILFIVAPTFGLPGTGDLLYELDLSSNGKREDSPHLAQFIASSSLDELDAQLLLQQQAVHTPGQLFFKVEI